jgi:sporulation protein YlmC with PRC-barrel domain
VELNGEPGAFSELIGTPVRDQGGRRLGRVFEVRAHWERDGAIVVDELMIGKRALWQRLRGPADEARGIPWENVAGVSREGITVRHPG